MGSLYPYSLLPVLSVSLLLFFTALRHGTGARGLAAFCLAVAAWSGVLLLIWFPSAATLGERFAAVGSFIAAAYLHAAWEITRQKKYGLVYFGYAVAVAITLGGVIWPGVIYGPKAMAKGPLFWPIMVLAIAAAVYPIRHLWRAYQLSPEPERPRLRRLFIAGVLADTGGLTNALLLAHGLPLPYGMLLVLGGLLVLVHVIREHEKSEERRLLDRSLLYSAIAAFLSAGFLFGVMSLMSASEPFLGSYRFGAVALLLTAALAFEPLRQQIQEALGRRIIPDRASASDLSRALSREEARADQAERLAELGAFASAVAHEVRNPLGVLAAHVKVLERRGADGETIAAIQEQIDRAARFVDDLLKYGRPRPLELRLVDLAAIAELAVSTAKQGLGRQSEDVEILRQELSPALVEADQAQLLQVLVIVLDNALLALQGTAKKQIRVSTRLEGEFIKLKVEDSGPGISLELMPRLFQPFVTGRGREGTRPGTGLGLAIARSIVERHHGKITASRSSLGGAELEMILPKVQPVLAAKEK
jgi:signal transduction histidine kinase